MLAALVLAPGLALLLLPASAHAQQQVEPPAVTAAERPPGYQLALTGGLSVGEAGWGTETGRIAEVGARAQVVPSLGIGVSYLHLGAPNNEGADAFGFDALELSAAWHPVVGRWFDPFLQAGALGVIGSDGGYMDTEHTSRFGLEGMAGLDVVRLPFAVGVHVRSGFTSRAWALAGLHVELRI